MKNDLTYNKAFTELEKLVNEIENDNVPLDKLSDKVKKANEYINFCETKLRTFEADIKKAVTQTTTKKKNAH